jgi:uncharacterized protein YdiU (UPF0061 family)
LLPLINPDSEDQAVEQATAALKKFSTIFEHQRNQLFCKKIGVDVVDEKSIQLVNDLLSLMQSEKRDFIHTFQQLTTGSIPHSALVSWHSNWEMSLNHLNISKEKAKQVMASNNPVAIPRNFILEDIFDEVESTGDLTRLYDVISILKEPYNPSHIGHPLSQPRAPGTKPTVTYCGT